MTRSDLLARLERMEESRLAEIDARQVQTRRQLMKVVSR